MAILLKNAYCLISGKNWKLSLAEIASYFAARNFKFEVSGFNRSYFIVHTQKQLDPKVIDELGGTLKIVQIAATVPTKKVTKAFAEEDKKVKKQLKYDLPLDALAYEMPRAESGKSVFGVSVYWSDPVFRHGGRLAQRWLGSTLKDELKEQDKKARFMGFPRDRENPQLTPVEVLKQGLVESHAEVVLCIGKTKTFIGTTIAVHNPFEFQKRDVEKPVQRKIFGISPRVAKILVNLSRCTAEKVFLDPFCGVGNVLLEALLTKARVVGLDINRWCVDAARTNLKWLAEEYSLADVDFSVVQGDAKNIRYKIRDEIDCIATEPDLGPALKEIPTSPYAEKILTNLKPLFEGFLSEAHEVLKVGGYLALVTPYIKTRSGKAATMGIQEIARKIGFEVVQPFADITFVEDAADFPLRDLSSFVDVDERHKIGRQVSLFRKPS